MIKKEVEGFLSHIASRGKVSASTQRQALNAVVFLYGGALDQPIGGEIAHVRAKPKPEESRSLSSWFAGLLQSEAGASSYIHESENVHRNASPCRMLIG
jgi:hypothetical protein